MAEVTAADRFKARGNRRIEFLKRRTCRSDRLTFGKSADQRTAKASGGATRRSNLDREGFRMSSKGSNGGIGFGTILAVGYLIWVVPKPVWITLGVLVGAAILIGGMSWAVVENDKRLEAKRERQRTEQAALVAAAKREREEKARKEKQQRINTLGSTNAAVVESALAAVKQVGKSEAARAGWLGDVDFTADIRGVTDNFQKAHALGEVVDKLTALDKPNVDDRKLLAEAGTAVANLERAACERVELIGKCATQARLVDKSLRTEREDARTAEQRADLHAKLSAMLYGIEADPDTTPTDSAADAVMGRVQGYLEIKNDIQQARENY